MFANLVSKYQSWNRYRQTYKELSRLSDRELDDIGLARCEISMALRKGQI